MRYGVFVCGKQLLEQIVHQVGVVVEKEIIVVFAMALQGFLPRRYHAAVPIQTAVTFYYCYLMTTAEVLPYGVGCPIGASIVGDEDVETDILAFLLRQIV